jgi:hypothetical protein
MSSLRKASLAIAGLATVAVALAQEEAARPLQETWNELDPVVIVGEQTPPLWKLSKNGNVLWILGTFSTQPRYFQLNSRRLDNLIAASQEVVFPGAAYTASAGTEAMPLALKSDRNPGGATLQSLMSADDYAKWLALRQKYASGAVVEHSVPKFSWGGSGARWVVMTEPFRGGDGIDTLRPTLAWEGVRRAAMDRYGLVSYDLESMVSAIAKKHGVPVRKLRPGREIIFIWKPDPLMKNFESKKEVDAADFAASTSYGDIDCLTANLDLLEPVLEMLKLQTAAWARGDLATWRSADSGARLRACVTELVAAVSAGRLPSSADAKQGQDRYHRARHDSNKEVQQGWVRAVQGAVKKNKVTFSMVPIEQLLAEDGYLAALHDKGFVLEDAEPAEVE